MNMPTKIGGICFSATSDYVMRDESLTPIKLMESVTASQAATLTPGTHSPESVPTISDASTFMSNMTKEAPQPQLPVKSTEQK
jgi:hypothetical protein